MHSKQDAEGKTQSSKTKKTIGIKDITKRTQADVLARFTDEQLEEFREVYNMFDKDNAGILTTQTIATVMKSLGQTPTETDLIDLLREVDKDNSGDIDFYEFVSVISHRMQPGETQQELKQAFELFDKNQDGWITADELKLAMISLNIQITDVELRQMIELVDNTETRRVSFEDFCHAVICVKEKK
ncbi:unnamed protein product [Didymodactylos carnosus]|uniref:EF-hand domain-containing protein n=1 Tax=Didymodactylos carnosus TaxID=1234261 RepID=A0A8S2PBS4_9BILA|nr:unnamed protein product [Didymodactylos carnosus]CAF4044418.1 unnamed protein product [Didymodactylos carnosus]